MTQRIMFDKDTILASAVEAAKGEPVYCACGDLIGYGPTEETPMCWDCKNPTVQPYPSMEDEGKE